MKKAKLYLAALTVLAAAASALAQATAFSYEGELRTVGVNASGLHDFRFRLYDAPSLGNQLGSVQCIDNVNVSDGRFNATIDFGRQFDSAAPRFLEIEVRQDTGLGCAATTGYTLLLPRQPITATPRVTAATVAYSLSAPDGSPAIAVFVDNDGRIGMGTTAPTHSVHVANPSPTLALQDSASIFEQVGYVSYRDSGNVERAWVGYGSPGDPDFTVLNARNIGDIVLNPLVGGNVGIGTSSPAAKLEVRGDIRFGTSAQYFPPTGDQSFGIVRGTVGGAPCSNATAVVGDGFTVTHAGSAQFDDYVVTFDVPFFGPPSVVGSSFWDSFFGGKYVTITNVSATGFRARLFASDGNSICRDWSFIAIGFR